MVLAMLVLVFLPRKINVQAHVDRAPGLTEPVSTALYAEENALITCEQRPGNSVVIYKALLSKPGYVVVHTLENGSIPDSFKLLVAAESGNISLWHSQAPRVTRKCSLS